MKILESMDNGGSGYIIFIGNINYVVCGVDGWMIDGIGWGWRCSGISGFYGVVG